MSHYYYNTESGSFSDCTSPIQGVYLVGLTEAEYHLSRLLTRGYSFEEITGELFSLAIKMGMNFNEENALSDFYVKKAKSLVEEK